MDTIYVVRVIHETWTHIQSLETMEAAEKYVTQMHEANEYSRKNNESFIAKYGDKFGHLTLRLAIIEGPFRYYRVV